MIIDSTGGNKVTYGETKEYKTTIDIENLDFIATLLSSNLYSNPEASFIREIVSNGWDSQVEAGNTDKPLIVKLKSNGSTYNITIRDYGTGLSKEQFENIYCKIGTSTKRNSNSFLGAFGIGKFSTMAVSKVAYITSYYNGTARLYVMTKDGNSITTNLMSEMPTTEHNGLEITVKNIENAWKYKEALDRLTFFPNVYVDGPYNQCNSTKIKRYKYFTACNQVFGDKLLLGNVLYPIDSSIIPAELTPFYEAIVKSGIVFNFNIGEIQVTPNREQVIYNTKTNALIIERIKAAKDEIENLVNPHVAKDYKNPYDYYNVVRSYFQYDFFNNKLVDRNTYYRDDSPRLTIEMFDFDVTLDGKHITNLSYIWQLKDYYPHLRGIVTKDAIYKDDHKWAARRYLDTNTKILFIKAEFKLGIYTKPYLIHNYASRILMVKPELQDFLSFCKNRWQKYSQSLTDEEEHIITCCYNHLISRGSDLDLDTDSDFIKFKTELKAENKANKVPANTGKVILTVWRGTGRADNYYNKSEFKSYADALAFIKKLKGGTLFKNLDETAIAQAASILGYNTIAANKKVMEWLNNEELTSKITEETILKHKDLIIHKTVNEVGFHIGLPMSFIKSLNPRLKEVVMNTINSYNKSYCYAISTLASKAEVDEDLAKDLKEVMNCYKIYSEIASEVNDTTDRNIQDILYYVIMKQKGYKINYDCYKKIKQNKLLSLICKK